MTTNDKFFSDEAINAFFVESREGLEDMEGALLKIEKGEVDDDLLNLIFRTIHTIKGSSGMFGFDEIENFSHKLESLLDDVRKKIIEIDSEFISLMLECRDNINYFLDMLESNVEYKLEGDHSKKTKNLIKRINKYNKNSDEPVVDTKEKKEKSKKVMNKCWHISLRFGREIFKMGMDPKTFIAYLEKIGEIVNLALVDDSLPMVSEIDPELCYLGFEIDLMGKGLSKEKIEEVFDFVKEDCMIKILPPKSSIDDYLKLIEELPEKNSKIGELLINIGSLTEKELGQALIVQKDSDDSTENNLPIGEIMVQEKMIHKPVLEAALEKQENIRKKQSSMRIDSEKLDSLINLVGELVITGANIKQLSEAHEIDRSSLLETASIMTRLIEYIRDTTMSIRMVPIGETFKRFERIVRDVSKEKSKEIDLQITGGDTELDKSLIEKLTDPLMHLIRNSIDHGIDEPSKREKKGKPGKGLIKLNAYHETGNVVIEVSDDGDGLNREKIFSKAVASGLVNPNDNLSDQELFQCIFEAGFSTASEVTNISGRGVGMDVVRKNIESLRGTIILDSKEGEGTKVKIHVPLTLSIIDGFMFKVGHSYCVIPLDIVIECTEATREELHAKDGGNYINLRGEVLPFMSLRDFFHVEGEEPDLANVVVVRHRDGMAGLVVDNLVGELQTVIKPLGEIFTNLKWISGSTILGTGEVALILDVPNLIRDIKTHDKTESKIVEEQKH